MASKLDVISIAFDATTNKTTIGYNRYNTDNADQNDIGSWIVDGNLTPEQALAYAQSEIAPELKDQIAVALNLSDKSLDAQTADIEAKHDEAVKDGEPINTDLGNGAEKAS